MITFAPIGLTGGIASGKSTVAGFFRTWGAFVADADEISRHALDPGTACYERTVAAFGRGILCADGTVDRKKVAALVFSDQALLATLNGIIHPYVRETIQRMSEQAFAESPDRLIVWDVPLLFETGYDRDCAKTVVVTARQDLRIQHRGAGRLHPGGSPQPHPRPDAGSGEGPAGGSGHSQQRLPRGVGTKNEGSIR